MKLGALPGSVSVFTDRTSLARVTVALPHSVISQLGPPGAWSILPRRYRDPLVQMVKSRWIKYLRPTISWSSYLRWRTPSVE